MQNFKQKKHNINFKLNTNNNLDELDKELIKGLEHLNNTSNKINNKNNINEKIKSNKQLSNERKILRNPKFKEIISMINSKNIKKYKKYNFDKNDFLDFKKNNNNNYYSTIKFFSPKRYKYLSKNLENNSFGNIYKKNGINSNKIYISCIDGKAIVNGIRKDIPFISKFNYNKLNSNKSLFCDFNQTYNAGKSARRNNSFNFNKYFNRNEFNFEEKKNQNKYNINSGTNDYIFDKIKNNYSKEYLTNKLNNMNDYHFSRELKFCK